MFEDAPNKICVLITMLYLVQLTKAGNFLPLILKVLPTGEKQRITCIKGRHIINKEDMQNLELFAHSVNKELPAVFPE